MRQFLVKQGYTQQPSSTSFSPSIGDSGASTTAPGTDNPSQTVPKPGLFDKIAGAAQHVQDFAVGAAKGAVNTFKGAADLGAKLFSPFGADTHATDVIPHDTYTPNNTSEKVGFGAEQIAEFLVPSGAIGGAQKAVTAAGDATKFGTLGKAAVKVVGRAAVEAGATGAIRAAQTGSVKEGAKAGATFGAIKLGTGAIGEVLKTSGFPEWLYSKVFKNTYQDMYQELDSGALKTLQQTKPDWFKQMVDSGVIKTGADGRPIINDTLAKEALNNGLQGSIKNMAVALKQNLISSESAVRQIAADNADKVIALRQPQAYANVLQQIANEYENVGFGETSQTASALAQKAIAGKINPEEAVTLRRFLDSLRIQRSYGAPITSPLSLSQANLKTLADALREPINKLPGMGKVMEDYAFSIDAMESIAKEAARRGNREVFGLLDTLFLSQGLGGGSPGVAAGVGMLRKTLMTPTGLTKTAQAIQNSGPISQVGAVIKGAAAQLFTKKK